MLQADLVTHEAPFAWSAVMFAIARTAGGMAHWAKTMADEEFRISRLR